MILNKKKYRLVILIDYLVCEYVCVFIFELIECFYSLFGYRYEKKLLLTFIDKTVRCNFKALNKLRRAPKYVTKI